VGLCPAFLYQWGQRPFALTYSILKKSVDEKGVPWVPSPMGSEAEPAQLRNWGQRKIILVQWLHNKRM
jgi:hypothetical protein